MNRDFAHDNRCHAYRCDSLGMNVISVEGGRGVIARLCDSHMEIEALAFEHNARENHARLLEYALRRSRGGEERS